jgi:tRNA 2-selenouridine synthase
MKEAIVLTIDEVVAHPNRFDDILDARSPSEYGLDHLPDARSTPVLNDEERATVGTLYKQQSGFEAKRVGAALVARNIANLIESQFADKPRGWQPLVYCWRGGNRSGSLATILTRIGWRCHLLEGGYKAYRSRVLADLEQRPKQFQFIVLAGRTGSGKSALLRALHGRGEQVLDLEALADHRGSVLGALVERPQPSQRLFESRLWHALGQLNPDRPVWVESESRRIGGCHQPESLIQSIRGARCVVIEAKLGHRAHLLLDEYRHFVDDADLLGPRLERLIPLHGHQQIKDWQALAGAGQWRELVESLLTGHYDPAYDRSMRTNFSHLGRAPRVHLGGTGAGAIEQAASELIECARAIDPASGRGDIRDAEG